MQISGHKILYNFKIHILFIVLGYVYPCRQVEQRGNWFFNDVCSFINDMVINTRKGENSNKCLIYATEYVLKNLKYHENLD